MYCMAPITTSADRNTFLRTFGWRVEVKSGLPSSCRMVRNLEMSSSNTFTKAPNASAARAAIVPATPAPMITTSVGDTPGMPPRRIPFPPWALLNNSAASVMEEAPSISEIEVTNGETPVLSLISSYARALIFSPPSVRG